MPQGSSAAPAVVRQGRQRNNHRPRPRRCLPRRHQRLRRRPLSSLCQHEGFSPALAEAQYQVFPFKIYHRRPDTDFLRHTTSPTDLMPTSQKVEALMEMPSPEDRSRYAPVWVDFPNTGISWEV